MKVALSLSLAVLSGLLAAACDSPTPVPNNGGSGGTGGGTGGSGAAAGNGGAGGGESAPVVIDTDKGAVEGFVDGSTRHFFGVPYAAPPVGDLRWKPPAEHEGWSETLESFKKGRGCPQNNPLNGNFDASSGEDCLTLNIWAPEKPKSGSLPVMVWIHGGAFVLGSGSEAAYDGRNFSEATGAIVVGINYRLGPLGFLALPELKSEDGGHPSSGNYGIEDQRAALEWVKANIAKFGGDPGNVTIFGESAGGISSCLHLVSPQSKGLFHRAILQSGPCDTATDETDAMTQGATFVEKLGCAAEPDVLACLRGKPTEEVMAALPASTDFLGGETRWFPVLDGHVIPEAASSVFASGDFEKVPVILGSNADEGTLFLQLAGVTIPDEATFEALAEQLAPGKGADVVARYPSATYGSAQAAATKAIGDAAFVCPTRRAVRALSAAGVDTYLYHFTYAPPGSLFGDLGAFHSAEVKFVFGNPGQLLPKAPNEEELPMSQAMMGYWSRLGASGDPNGGDAFVWPKYDAATDENIVLDLTISKQSGLKKDLCDFWDTIDIDGV